MLLWDFTNDFRERLKYLKLCHKGDLDGDDDNLFWHFTRLSVLKNMLSKGEIWLTDLAFSNDENEIVYALNRVKSFVSRFAKQWPNKSHAKLVRRAAKMAAERFLSDFHVYAFSLSTERDTVVHWDGYGGGLRNLPVADDPYVSIGLDARSLFYPIELSGEQPDVYCINTVNGDDSADHLIQYWTIKARKMIEVVDAKTTPLSLGRAMTVLQNMLVLASALAKSEGWRAEQEYRLLYITERFGEEDRTLPKRPKHHGRYVPVKWLPKNLPIRAVVPHPLADPKKVRSILRTLPGGKRITVIPSGLRPRPK
jgi:hypothetical protein